MARIVVVDDEQSVRRVLTRSLNLGGHQVLTFEDGATALAQVDFDGVDLLITDLQMPMTGDQIIRQLNGRGISVPVLVLSGYLDEGRRSAVKALGVKRTLEKPFDLDELLEMVDECAPPRERSGGCGTRRIA